MLIILFIFSNLLFGQSVEKIGKAELLSLLSQKDDTTYVINFWATWCSPCVKEIAYFENLHRYYSQEEVKVLLVSLDFPNQVENRVIPFLKERNISAEVKLMTDIDYNSWIDLVDPAWSGAIPATLVYNKDSRIFLEKELNEAELNEIVEQIHN